MSKFRYPTDTDQFQLIREQGYFYVDKTDLIYDLVSNNNYVFLARPRRFGKSLLCNTLKAYFQGQKELFTDLKIMELEKEWKKYPVLHFTMSGLKNCSVPMAQSKLECFLRDYEEIYGRKDSDNSPGARFRTLIRNAVAQTGEKAVVILDEYDSPIMRLLYEPQLNDIRTMLREFYQVLKDEGAYLRFVFITGVTKFSQLSIFSELNNLKQISMLDKYSGLCGFTQHELDTVMLPCVEEYAEALNLSTDTAYSLLKKNYDGYHFSKNSQDVYAPFSLLNALTDKECNHYWFESGTSSSLIEHLKKFPNFNPLECDGMLASDDEFNIPCEEAETPIPLLYQSGYLTIANYNAPLRTYTLKFPNYEVKQGMIRVLMPIILKRTTADGNALVRNMAEALLNGNLNGSLFALRSYIAKIPYDIITLDEWQDKEKRESFYKLLMYMIFSMLNSTVDTEVKSILGRADVVVQTQNDVFVLELKVDKSVDDALAQIDDKGYSIPYEACGRKITKCGVSISSEARNIMHWKITGDNGEFQEEKFNNE